MEGSAPPGGHVGQGSPGNPCPGRRFRKLPPFDRSSPAFAAPDVYIGEIMKTAYVAYKASFIIALSFSAVLVGCGPTSTLGSSSPTPATSVFSSPTATASPASSSSPVATATPQPPPGFTCADASGGSEQTGSDVVGVCVGQHDGYDRLVIEFSDSIPSYSVQRRSGASFTGSPRGQWLPSAERMESSWSSILSSTGRPTRGQPLSNRTTQSCARPVSWRTSKGISSGRSESRALLAYG